VEGAAVAVGAGVRDDEASAGDVDGRADDVDERVGDAAGVPGAGVRDDEASAGAVADDVDGRADEVALGVPAAGVRDDEASAGDVDDRVAVPDAGVPDDGVPDGVVDFSAPDARAGAPFDAMPDDGVPECGVPDGVAADGDVDGRAADGDVDARGSVFEVVARATAGVPAGGVARDGVPPAGVTAVCACGVGVPTGGVCARRAAASASCVVMPPLELVLPIAFNTDEMGDDGGSSSGTGVAARSAVGESGFTLPVGGRVRCALAAAGVGGGAVGVGGGVFERPFVSIAAVEARLTVLILPVVVAVVVRGGVGIAGADSRTSFASASSWTTGVCWSSCHSASSIASSS
jgi:hypothetical protein